MDRWAPGRRMSSTDAGRFYAHLWRRPSRPSIWFFGLPGAGPVRRAALVWRPWPGRVILRCRGRPSGQLSRQRLTTRPLGRCTSIGSRQVATSTDAAKRELELVRSTVHTSPALPVCALQRSSESDVLGAIF